MPLEALTERRVQTARPAEGQERLELRDTKVRGLELRVGQKEDSKRWAFIYTRRSDSRVRRVTLGRYPDLTLAEARTKAIKLRSDVAEGADPANTTQVAKAASTFKELAEEWVERHGRPNKSPHALRDNLSMLDRHINPVIGAIKADDVTKRDIIRLLDRVAAQADARFKRTKKSPRTNRSGSPHGNEDVRILNPKRKLSLRPNRVYELVRAIYRWGVGRDIVSADPTIGMKAPVQKEPPRERVLNAEELREFFARLPAAPVSASLQLAILLALVTAQRIGEVVGMTQGELELDCDEPIWTLPAHRTKNREGHRVPLSPLAVDLIKQAADLAGDSEYLFPSPKNDQPIGTMAATRAMVRARPILGLDDFRIHDLRRTAATGMAQLGVSPHTISLVLNHVSARKGTITAAVYVKYSYDAEKRAALDAWGQRLNDILGEPMR